MQAELIALAVDCARECLPIMGARVIVGEDSYTVLLDGNEVKVFGKPGWWLVSFEGGTGFSKCLVEAVSFALQRRVSLYSEAIAI